MTPVFLYLFLGLLEMGLFFHDYQAAGASASDGARTASIVGNDVHADYTILQSVKRGMSTVPNNQIQSLIVFDPSNPAACSGSCNVANPVLAQPPASCLASTVHLSDTTSECNTYVPATDWPAAANTNYECGTPRGSAPKNLSMGYCPLDRKTAKTNALGNGPPSFVGVTLVIKHQYVSGLFGKTKLIVDTVIASIEPQSLE